MELTIRHQDRDCRVWFGPLGPLIEKIPRPRYILTDANVAPHLPSISDPIRSVTPGEASKCLAEFARAQQWLAEHGARRDSTLVAVGGGVVGDLGGFVAATYMRGIDVVQVPTTLMAQVDSAIGGKTGVDLESGKNMVGAFHAPVAVLIDVSLLASLPEREFRSGAAEVWKYGAILDAELFRQLEDEPLYPRRSDLPSIVRRCIELKAAVVEADEFERTGLRATLNFGHTVGHAIEAETGFGPVRHGEAVAIGMVAEARLGERLGTTPAGVADRLRSGLSRQGLPTAVPPALDPTALVERMRLDKKARASGLRFSLLEAIGRCTLIGDVDERIVLDVLKNE